jgi:phosphate transport system substrate-binding protein
MINFWAANYTAGHSNVTIAYSAVGSGAGQLATADKTVDFGASDAPLSTGQRPMYPNLLTIPETIGSVTVAYHIPTGPNSFLTANLNFTGSLIGDIYLGKVHLWNDPAIANLQSPAIAAMLPDKNITTVRRQDNSGTTFVFTSYLSLVNPTFATKIGASANNCSATQTTNCVNWQGNPTCNPFPCQITGTGNGGVAGQILGGNYTLGYVELNYALTHSITFGALLNADKTAYVLPSIPSTFYAVENYTAVNTLPSGLGDWSHVSMLNQTGLQTYPLSSFTYLLVYKELNVIPSMNLNETTQAQTLIAFLKWIVTTGQPYAELKQNSYVSLPPSVISADLASINSITYTIKSTPVTHNYNIGASSATGFNVTHISVVSGDTVNLNLISVDGAPHQWFLDFNNNGVLDTDEIASPIFSSTTVATPFSFTPLIFNSRSVPSAGNFTIRDSQSAAPTSIFTIIPQQIAAPFVPPANNPTSTLFPLIDSSRVVTQGSVIVDLRTNSFSGNITVITTVGASVFATKVYSVTVQPSVANGVAQSLFVLNAAASPYTLSADVTIHRAGLTGTSVYTATRTLDIVSQGKVNIVDIATAALHYGASIGQPNYIATSDVLASGTIDIVNITQLAIFFDALAFS